MKKLALTAIVVFFAASFASADLISQTQSYSSLPNYSQPLTFNQFDTMGGTRVLDSIKVTAELTVTGGNIILDNDSETDASGTFEFGATATISSIDVALLDGSTPVPNSVVGLLNGIHTDTVALSPNFEDAANDFDPSDPDGMQYYGGTEGASDDGMIGSAYFAGFMGSGTFNINAIANQFASFQGVGGVEVAYTPVTALTSVTIEYTYHTVPEPATLCLLVMGGLPLIARRIRRKIA